MSKAKRVLLSGVMVALYCVPKEVVGEDGDTGMMRLGAMKVPLEMSVGHDAVVVVVEAAVGVVADDATAAFVVSEGVDVDAAAGVAVDVTSVDDGLPRAAQLKPPAERVILVQPVELLSLSE